MIQISIEDADFVRLQARAVPFVDTPASVITKLLDAVPIKRQDVTVRPEASSVFGPSSVPPLTHAKMMDGLFAGKAPSRSTWDGMVRLALNAVFRKTNSVEDVRKLSGANIAAGQRTLEGYKPLDGANFSYQGVSAEDAVKIVLRCARALKASVSIEFVWREKEGAHKPGERGYIRYNPEP